MLSIAYLYIGLLKTIDIKSVTIALSKYSFEFKYAIIYQKYLREQELK